MEANQKNYFLELLFATLLISTSGVLGKYIALDPPVIIWCRSFLALIVLYFYCRYQKLNLKILSRKDLPTLLLSGVFMAVKEHRIKKTSDTQIIVHCKLPPIVG